MQKMKGRYGYDVWADLTTNEERWNSSVPQDPSKSILELMQAVYDNGDDSLREELGKAFTKASQG